MPRVKFGWLTLAHSPSAEEDQAAIGEQLEQAWLAQARGVDGGWLAQPKITRAAV